MKQVKKWSGIASESLAYVLLVYEDGARRYFRDGQKVAEPKEIPTILRWKMEAELQPVVGQAPAAPPFLPVRQAK